MLTHEPLTGKDTRLVAQSILDAAPVVMHFIRSRVKRRPPGGAMTSVSQIRVLAFIKKHPGCTLSAISEFLGIARPTASTMVGRLVRDGLIARGTDRANKRNLLLNLTPLGEVRIDESRQATVSDLASVLADRGLSTAQLEQIEGAMGLLREIFSTIYQEKDHREKANQ